MHTYMHAYKHTRAAYACTPNKVQRLSLPPSPSLSLSPSLCMSDADCQYCQYESCNYKVGVLCGPDLALLYINMYIYVYI